ncbi:MAG TPA: adenosine deaminase [Hyphomicrobiales bacterium]|nr:adenosine deaminase [Hyphomicrobiales bacterium]
MADLSAFIRGLPKCELHVHIEGTLEPEMKFRLAARNGVELPYASADDMRKAYGFNDLTSFLKMYYEGMDVLRTEQDFYDLMLAYLERAAADNVRYAEIFFDPQAHTGRGIPFAVVIGGLARAQMDGEIRFGIRTRLIMCILRDQTPEYAMATLLEALPYRERILGIGLDSDERGNPPLKFGEVFRRARAEGFLLTMHCDPDQPDAVGHIRQCVHDIGVNRIDHGVNAIEDRLLCEEIKGRGLGLTVCPCSNRLIGGGSKAEIVMRMLDLGLRVTVNSDDPAYFGGYIADNFRLVAEETGAGREALLQLARNACEATWLSRAGKDALLAELEEYARSS